MAIAQIRDLTFDASGNQTTNSAQIAACEVIIADISAVTGTSVTITCDDIGVVKHCVVLPVGGGNEGDLAGLDVTFSGNTIVLADGTGMDISVDLAKVYIIAYGHNN